MQADIRHICAVLFKIANVVTFAIVSLIWKLKLPNLSSEQQYILQTATSTVTILIIMLMVRSSFKVTSLRSYIYRAGCNAIGIPVWLHAIKLIGINEAMAITYLSPVFTSILAVIFLKERVKLSWIVALVLGLCGIYIMIQFGPQQKSVNFSDDYIKGILLAILASASFSIYNIICKVQSDVDDDHLTQALYSFAIQTVFALPLSVGHLKTISFEETMWGLATGIIGGLSVVALFLSYKFSTVVRMSPHSYFKIIVTAVTMYILKDEVPSTPMVIAIALILIGNLCVVFEEYFYLLVSKLRKLSVKNAI